MKSALPHCGVGYASDRSIRLLSYSRPSLRAMKGHVFNGIHSGYVVWDPEQSLPELKYAGEEWAFPEYSTSIHTHPFHELHLQLSGSTEWETEQGSIVVEQNMLIGVAPHVRHRMRPLSHRAHHFIYCSLDIAGELAKCGLSGDLPIFQQPCFLIRHAEELAAPFSTLSREIRQSRPGREELINLSARTIAMMLYRFATSGPQKQMPQIARDHFGSTTLLKLKRHIEQHLTEKLSIADLTALLGISRSALFETCRKELGKSPAAYQMERRMEMARTMLKTPTLPLTQIAHELGFSSSQHFSSAFRKHFGVAPSIYRSNPHSLPNL